MKVCKKCNIKKELNEFCKRKDTKDGYHRYCKTCQKLENDKFYQDNKEKLKPNHTKYRKVNKKYFNEYSKQHYQNNKEYYNKYWKKRHEEDPRLKIRHSVVALIHHHLKSYQLKKTNHSVDYLGCDMKTYHNYLESQFDSNMSWANYGIYWEIDHIKPIDSFDLADSSQINECFNYKNTRPLEITENKIKSNKII